MNGMVKFYSKDVILKLSHRRFLKEYIKQIFTKEKRILDEVKFIFCKDDYLYIINLNYLNHNTLTDVITFDLSTSNKINGEVYISLERIQENSVRFKNLFNQELHKVIFHAILHLCGYTDKKRDKKSIMTQLENFYLSDYNRILVSRETYDFRKKSI